MTVPAAAKPSRRASRAARAAVPPLPSLDTLDQTHARMMEVLGDVATLLQHLDDHGVDAEAQRLAALICKFFSGHARQHHADEEALVFPGLLRAGDPALTQHVLRLQQDHGWLEEDWLELEPQLQAVAQGYSWYELDSLRYGVGVFTALLHEHIALEESLIYPEARRRMADENASREQRAAGKDEGSAG